MKVLFLGDSITEGIPGVSYVDILKAHFNEDELVNYGKGGDTISSLYKRIQKIEDLAANDSIVLFVGVNDVFGKLTTGFKIIKLLKKQPWSKNESIFSNWYQKTIQYLMTKTKKLIVVSPLFIGEGLDNKWNKQLDSYVASIKTICSEHPSIVYVDARKSCIDYLSGKEISSYMPIRVRDLVNDVNELKSSKDVDARSGSRGLHVTLDGVHINSKGAKIIADGIISAFTN